MAYDEEVANRVRKAFEKIDGVSEKKMFGGLAFMVRGNMCCGVLQDKLIVRVGPGVYESMLSKPNVQEMDFTGKPLTGFIYVRAEGFSTQKGLNYWIKMGLEYVLDLPEK